jgi:16S rRNA (guanine(966)-N(2))-methyltransferase RsmD
MRIIGGQAKGRRIAVPPGYAVRPTADRIKEALFNILASVDGLMFLDLYAGTGNVGMEALSRGAKQVVFVEKINLLVKSIKKNLDEFGFQGRYRIVHMDAEKAIMCLAQEGASFDLIFADPPYRMGLIDNTLGLLKVYSSILAGDGKLILQHVVSEPLKLRTDTAFELEDSRRYGDTILSFLRHSRQ